MRLGRLGRLTTALVTVALLAPAAASAESFDPSDEFKLKDWVPIHIGGLDLSITKAVAYLMLASVVTIVFGLVFMRMRLGVRPGSRQTFGEIIYDLAQSQIAEQGLPSKAIGLWFPYVATLFLFVWIVNLLGFIPLPLSNEHTHVAGVKVPTFGIYAATSSISVTLALALLTFVFTHVEGIRHNGPVRYFKSWIPEVPKPMLILIVPLEVLGQFMRLISLSVRLFANMLAGHMTILIFLVLCLSALPYLIPLLLLGSIMMYAFDVALIVTIQAFIFALLSSIYIGSAIEPEH
jgi:F-type H+-transporting ATPase subunit a